MNIQLDGMIREEDIVNKRMEKVDKKQDLVEVVEEN